MPLALNLVPARRHESREISVNVDGKCNLILVKGLNDAGIVTVET